MLGTLKQFVMHKEPDEAKNNLDLLFGALKHLDGRKLLANVEFVNADKYNFSRTISFEVFDNKYKIVWYVNHSTLYINENVQVIFDNLEISGTWPNNFKKNLQFYRNDEVCCVVPIEKYEVK